MNGLSDVRLTLQPAERTADRRVLNKPAPDSPLGQRWRLFLRRLRTRRALLELSDAQLRDIGLSREQARAEAQLPFWRA